MNVPIIFCLHREQVHNVPLTLSSPTKLRGTRRIKGTSGQRSNGFRLSDIGKVIEGRHGTTCQDLAWSKRYLRVALPHILADTGRLIAAKGSHLDAVLSWVDEWVPLLRWDQDDEWIGEQVRACLAKPPRRRCPRIDHTNNLLRIEDHEPKAYGLCSLSAMSRPKKVRDAEDRIRRAQAEQDRRAKDPNYTPRSESKAAQIRAAGDNVNTVKSRERRARLAAAKTAEAAVHPSSCPEISDMHPGSCPTVAPSPCTLVRALHLEYPRAPISAPQIQGATYVPFPLPTPEQHASTMAALHAGADAAWEEFGRVVGF